MIIFIIFKSERCISKIKKETKKNMLAFLAFIISRDYTKMS